MAREIPPIPEKLRNAQISQAKLDYYNMRIAPVVIYDSLPSHESPPPPPQKKQIECAYCGNHRVSIESNCDGCGGSTIKNTRITLPPVFPKNVKCNY